MYKAVDTQAVIWASQPSDCKLLHRDNIQCASIDNLIVRFDRPFMYDINGPAHLETLEDWLGAIQHLLSTYQPYHASISFGDHTPGMQREFTLNVRDGGTYTGLLTRDQECLFLLR